MVKLKRRIDGFGICKGAEKFEEEKDRFFEEPDELECGELKKKID